MKKLIIVLAMVGGFLVSGCATVPSFYQKTGVTEEQRKQDYKECSKEAARLCRKDYWTWAYQSNPATGQIWFERYRNACMKKNGYIVEGE